MTYAPALRALVISATTTLARDLTGDVGKNACAGPRRRSFAKHIRRFYQASAILYVLKALFAVTRVGATGHLKSIAQMLLAVKCQDCKIQRSTGHRHEQTEGAVERFIGAPQANQDKRQPVEVFVRYVFFLHCYLPEQDRRLRLPATNPKLIRRDKR